jgi:hypothetical protein
MAPQHYTGLIRLADIGPPNLRISVIVLRPVIMGSCL